MCSGFNADIKFVECTIMSVEAYTKYDKFWRDNFGQDYRSHHWQLWLKAEAMIRSGHTYEDVIQWLKTQRVVMQ